MEKELRKAFEDTTTNNLKSVICFSKETRMLFREHEKKITILENLINNQNAIIGNMRTQLVHIQTKLISGGSV